MDDRKQTESAAVTRAMNRVLDAERNAEAAVEAARQEADQRISQAMTAVRHLREQTRYRIAKLHKRAMRRIKAENSVLEHVLEDNPGAHELSEQDRANIEAAARRLARQLTGADGGQ